MAVLLVLLVSWVSGLGSLSVVSVHCLRCMLWSIVGRIVGYGCSGIDGTGHSLSWAHWAGAPAGLNEVSRFAGGLIQG